MLNALQKYGRHSEDLAAKHLRRSGYKIIMRNFRTPYGEIDIIARHKGSIVFIEVKARRSKRFGLPQEAITTAKQRKLSMAALVYLKRYDTIDTQARFDVVTIQDDPISARIEIITNAFELAYT